MSCNAAALKILGVEVLDSLHLKYLNILSTFINQKQNTKMYFPDETEEIIYNLISENVKLDYPITTASLSFS